MLCLVSTNTTPEWLGQIFLITHFNLSHILWWYTNFVVVVQYLQIPLKWQVCYLLSLWDIYEAIIVSEIVSFFSWWCTTGTNITLLSLVVGGTSSRNCLRLVGNEWLQRKNEIFIIGVQLLWPVNMIATWLRLKNETTPETKWP